MPKRLVLCSGLTLFSLLPWIVNAGAQSSMGVGSIAGIVMDPSGAVIPGAEVTATNQATGEKYSVRSNPEGSYRFERLATGIYGLRFELRGFQTETKTSIAVGGNNVTELDIHLAVGTSSDTWWGPTVVPVPVITRDSMPKLTGDLVGTVVDHRNVPAPGVRVTGIDSDGTHFQATTNCNGVYRISDLPPGSYTVRFEARGLRPQTTTQASVLTSQETRLDSKLKKSRKSASGAEPSGSVQDSCHSPA
jgi:hypothetical protein